MAQAHWIRAVSGKFNTAGDWSTGVTPGAADDVILDAAGATPYTVTAAGAVTVNSFQTSSNATLNITGSFAALNGTGAGVSSGLVQLMDGGTLTLQGVVAIPNLLTVNGDTEPTTVVIGAGGVTLKGPFSFSAGNSLGSLILNFEGEDQQIVGATDTALLDIVNARVSGQGQLGEGRLVIHVESQGFIEAKGLGTLVINTGANTIINAGLMDAEGAPSSSLVPVEGLVESPIDNTGTLEADGQGASFVVEGAVTGVDGRAVITGGLLEFDSSFNQSVTFEDSSGELLLGDAQGFGSPIIAFSSIGGETLDFRDIGFVDATEASFSGSSTSGVLTVSDGVHSTSFPMLLRNYLQATFVASADGDGGVLITTATPLHWLSAASGDFSTAANWTAGTAPGSFDSAILDATGSPYTVSVSTPRTVAVIETDSEATLSLAASLADTNGSGPGANAGEITVGQAAFTIGGTFANSGSVTLSGSSAGDSTLIVAGSGVTLDGGGVVLLGGDFVHAAITGASATATLTNVDETITGGGQLGGGEVTVDNQASGVIDANEGALTVDTGARTLTNAGVIEASGAGRLFLQSQVIDDSSGGRIAAAGGQIQLVGVRVLGGALTTSGPGAIWAEGSGNVLDGRSGHAVSLDGDIRIAANGSLTLEGAIANNNVIEIGGSSTAAKLLVAGGVTLSGGGRVALGDGGSNAILASGAASLTNVDNLISAVGLIGGAGLTLINQAKGVIAGWSATTKLTIDTGAQHVVNAGDIISNGAGGIVIQSPVNNTGLLTAAKGTLVVAGAVTGAGTVRIAGGVADFAGSFTENVTFASGSSGVLELARSTAYNGAISGFSHSGATALDLDDIDFGSSTRLSFSGGAASGVLTVTDGTHTARIHLKGDYRTSIWTVASDGRGGTRVIDPASNGSRVNVMASAMAGMTPSPEAAAAQVTQIIVTPATLATPQ